MKSLPQIMVAPNGARLTKKDHPGVPVTIAEVVAETVACAREGADGVHAHVRDDGQQHVLDAGLYNELLAELKHVLPDFFVQITTEAVGRYTPQEQRALVRDVHPEAVSIAVREMIQGEDSRTLRTFYHECHEANMAVQHILYDLADVRALKDLVSRDIVPAQDLQALIVLGRYAPGQKSSPADLGEPAEALLSLLPGVDWGICAFGARETECLLAAAQMGGKARIGFENNRMNRDLTCAANNAERVRELVKEMAPSAA
jgi:uncharacterized protein (DUF849 family)